MESGCAQIENVVKYKFKYVREALECIKNEKHKNNLYKRIQCIERDYIFCYCRFPDQTAQFINKIASHRIINRLETVFINITRCEHDAEKLKPLHDHMSFLPIHVRKKANKYDECCGETMIQNGTDSELYCLICKMTKKMVGCFTSEQSSGYTSGKPKHGNYMPCRHGKLWLQRTIGETIPKVTDDEYLNIERCIARDRITSSNLTIGEVRRVLSELGLSKYNSDASYIYLKYSDQKPIHFTHSECDAIISDYGRVFRAVKQITSIVHIKYVPFLLQKIIELRFPGDADKAKIKKFIHFQGLTTRQETEKIWKKACEKLSWKYIRTRIL
uniref:Uncharacterized protein n=1 Tax=viral metagenome TaxID=1070528 RepID=A0A6C0IUU4_9ZZZZ